MTPPRSRVSPRRTRGKNVYSARVANWREYTDSYSLWEKFSPYLRVRDMHVESMRGYEKVLDDGCGIGITTEALLQDPDQSHFVYAVDILATPIRALRDRLGEKYPNRWKAYRDDGARLRRKRFPNGSVDGVVSMFTINFVKDWKRYLAEAARVTREGGRISISGPLPDWKTEPIIEAFKQELGGNGSLEDPETKEKLEIVTINLMKNKNGRSISEPDPEHIAAILKFDLGYEDIDIKRDGIFAGQSYFLVGNKQAKEYEVVEHSENL